MTNILAQQPIKYWAIIPAAGLGKRMGSTKPKQYLTLLDKTILEHTIGKLINYPVISKVVVVLHQDDQYWQQLSLPQLNQIITTTGGKARVNSVLQGLQALHELAAPNDWVLVHDAVRPCVRHQDLDRLIQQVEQHSVGGILGIPISDTLKHIDEEGHIEKTLSREYTWRAQTPQMFRYRLLVSALERALINNIDITDEASALEYIQKRPKMVYGDPRNLKITFAADLALAEKFLHEEQACSV